MIQRIQSIYLLLAILNICAIFFVDIAHFTDATGIENELSLYTLAKANGEVAESELGLLPTAFLSITAALLFVTILSYRNRSAQRGMIRIAYLLLIAAVVSIWYFVSVNYWDLEITEPDLSYRAGFYLPFVAFAFALLASRSIRKDEDLIKSLDRIR